MQNNRGWSKMANNPEVKEVVDADDMSDILLNALTLVNTLTEEERAQVFMEEESKLFFKKHPNRLAVTARERFAESGKIAWLVQDKIHAAGLGQIWAAPATGKTLWALDLALSVATGQETFQGDRIDLDGPQDVVYVAAEGGPAFWQQVNAWVQQFSMMQRDAIWDLLDAHFFVIDGAADEFLVFSNDAVDPERAWGRLVTEWTAQGASPALIVFDTQVDVIEEDENKNREMAQLLRDIKRHADGYGFCAMLVHHSGHDGTRGRGASSVRGKVDWTVGLKRVKSDEGAYAVEVMWNDVDTAKIKGRGLPEVGKVFTIATTPGVEGAYAKHIDNDVRASMFTASREVKRQNKMQELDSRVLVAVRNGVNTATKVATDISEGRNPVSSSLKRLEEQGKIKNLGSGNNSNWVEA